MKVVLIGAGNVGWHLGKKFVENGVQITQVFSRTKARAKALAGETGARFTDKLQAIQPGADLYLLAIRDDAISEVAAELANSGFAKSLVAHTSGATPMRVLAENGLPRCGIFYPVQTFTLNRLPDFTQIPICVDATERDDQVFLKQLARKISPHVHQLNDEERAVLHLAAVFVNNFSNHLFALGKSILDKEKLSFDLLLPLIRETVAKLETGDPAALQTGPAIRGDQATIERHLAFLKGEKNLAAVYEVLTGSIEGFYRK